MLQQLQEKEHKTLNCRYMHNLMSHLSQLKKVVKIE